MLLRKQVLTLETSGSDFMTRSRAQAAVSPLGSGFGCDVHPVVL